MDKLKAFRLKLKKEQQQKTPQQKKQPTLTVEQLGYHSTQRHTENYNNNDQTSKLQPQQQVYVHQPQIVSEVKQEIRQAHLIKQQQFGYDNIQTPVNQNHNYSVHQYSSLLVDQANSQLVDQNPNQSVDQNHNQPEIHKQPLKIDFVQGSNQNSQILKTHNQIVYGYQKLQEIPIPQTYHEQQQSIILQEPIHNEKIEPTCEQKTPQQKQIHQLGYKQPQFDTPIKQQTQQVLAPPHSAEQKKKSKMDILRQKIRLKKLTQTETLSNKSIPEEPKPHETKPQDLGYQNISEPHGQITKNTESKPQKIGYKDINEQQNNTENNHGTKKLHIDPVKQAVIFQNMREDHIPLGYIDESNNPIIEQSPQKQPQRPHQAKESNNQPQIIQNQINPQKPIVLAISHTLFYQLNQLQEYLKLKPRQEEKQRQEEKGPKDNNNIKEFVQQLSKLKENINHLNNTF